MAQVYSTLFVAQPSTVSTPPYTVAAGNVAILRNIDGVWGITADAPEFSLYVTTAAGTQRVVVVQAPIPSLSATWLSWAGRIVLPAGASFHVTTTDTGDFLASGYLLTTP